MQFTHKIKPGISIQNDMPSYTKKIFNTLIMHKDDPYVNIKKHLSKCHINAPRLAVLLVP